MSDREPTAPGSVERSELAPEGGFIARETRKVKDSLDLIHYRKMRPSVMEWDVRVDKLSEGSELPARWNVTIALIWKDGQVIEGPIEYPCEADDITASFCLPFNAFRTMGDFFQKGSPDFSSIGEKTRAHLCKYL